MYRKNTLVFWGKYFPTYSILWPVFLCVMEHYFQAKSFCVNLLIFWVFFFKLKAWLFYQVVWASFSYNILRRHWSHICSQNRLLINTLTSSDISTFQTALLSLCSEKCVSSCAPDTFYRIRTCYIFRTASTATPAPTPARRRSVRAHVKYCTFSVRMCVRIGLEYGSVMALSGNSPAFDTQPTIVAAFLSRRLLQIRIPHYVVWLSLRCATKYGTVRKHIFMSDLLVCVCAPPPPRPGIARYSIIKSRTPGHRNLAPGFNWSLNARVCGSARASDGNKFAI